MTESRVVRVLPDVTGIDKLFDYLASGPLVRVGTEVRVRLGARRVRGWIIAVDVESPTGVDPQPVLAVRGPGPAPEVIELAIWAARRWAGHPAHLLRLASPPSLVRSSAVGARGAVPCVPAPEPDLMTAALAGGPKVVRLPPTMDRAPFVMSLIASTLAERPGVSVLVVCPSLSSTRVLGRRLIEAGFDVVDVSADHAASHRSVAWSRAAAGGRVVIGTRNAAWAPAPDLALGIVVDEHDEALQSTRTPTWHARDVVAERARRARAPSVALSPCPSLDVLADASLVTVDSKSERLGWPTLEIIDRRDDDPTTASSVFSETLGRRLKGQGRVVCVLNRTGRVRLLACRHCGALSRCTTCGASVHASEGTDLVCPRCATRRPRVCAECGSSALKNLRIGVARAREELEALLGEPVDEVSGGRVEPREPSPSTRVVIGTEAVLHRVGTADAVVFLDIDAELTAPRFRAAEQAMTLLARAARLLGGRSSGRRLVVQTRLPEHPVLRAVASGDPSILSDHEENLRRTLRFPPFSALAVVSGPAAAAYVENLATGVTEVLAGDDGTFLVRAPDHDVLARTLGDARRPDGRLRIEVDPLAV